MVSAISNRKVEILVSLPLAAQPYRAMLEDDTRDQVPYLITCKGHEKSRVT